MEAQNDDLVVWTVGGCAPELHAIPFVTVMLTDCGQTRTLGKTDRSGAIRIRKEDLKPYANGEVYFCQFRPSSGCTVVPVSSLNGYKELTVQLGGLLILD